MKSLNIQKSFAPTDKGNLYLVATPIGNLEDMTFRAVRILREVDWIAAEDTRQTRKLLNHFEITGRLVSYHEHNKHASGPELVRLMSEGESVALVSDAGLPAISDPGHDLVKRCIEHHISVIPIPGPNAALSALIVSGMHTDRFVFEGFLPRDNKGIRQSLERYTDRPETILLYESPHRIEKTLGAILEVLGDRQVALVRELTKKYEEIIRGKVTDCIQHVAEYTPQGEYCIVIEGQDGIHSDEKALAPSWWDSMTVSAHVEAYVSREKIPSKDAIRLVAKDRGVPRREIYNQFEAEKKSLGNGS